MLRDCSVRTWRPLSIALQAVSCDLVKAHNDARSLIVLFRKLRNDGKFAVLYRRAETVAAEVGTKPEKPRTTGRQTNRANAGDADDSIEDHFRRNMFLPLVDHFIQYLGDRFPEDLQPLMMAQFLIPANRDQLTPDVVAKLHTEFKRDMCSPMTFSQEVERWKLCCKDHKTVISLSGALTLAGILFPNIGTILRLLLTLPVGSCSCERSFSAMRRLKTWQRSSMTEGRFNGLALLSVHDGDVVGQVDPCDILRRFDTGNRRIGHLFTDHVTDACVTSVNSNH